MGRRVEAFLAKSLGGIRGFAQGRDEEDGSYEDAEECPELEGIQRSGRWWNTPKHEDARRDGDIVVLAYKGPKTGPRHL